MTIGINAKDFILHFIAYINKTCRVPDRPFGKTKSSLESFAISSQNLGDSAFNENRRGCFCAKAHGETINRSHPASLKALFICSELICSEPIVTFQLQLADLVLWFPRLSDKPQFVSTLPA